jgi:death-on-curing family protein
MMDYNEPMGDFTTRYPNKLESCLEQPFATFGGEDLYPTLLNKAVLLFYLVIKNHPFENGNKRMAVILMLFFLFKNKKFTTVTPDDLYDLALIVARGDLPIEQHLPMIEKALEDFIIDSEDI